ncbi:hypothetical protein [Salinigranum sp. GCM10025319]|uniref:hypothetical protein n=1 Tax=Salinigranum sp. GCM10025319 TaxID=3252687 RepID=UPI00360FC7C8
MATESLDDLKESILDLSAEDRNRLLRRVAAGVTADPDDQEGTPFEAYCREYPDDPLCAGAVPAWGTSTSTPTPPPMTLQGSPTRPSRRQSHPDRSHLRGFPSGGGCAEAWEFLSAMRGGN